MEHVVFYQSAQGVPAFRRVGSLEDAVSFAEHLRNVEGVTDFSVYSLAPVTLSMRAYYHVEVSGGEGSAEVPSQAPAAAAPTAPGAEVPPPLPPDAPPVGAPFETAAPTPALSFNALEEEASAPVGNVPFAAAPLPPTGSPITETFVKDDPPPANDAPSADADTAPIDPSVVDPTTEEVVPASSTGRRSMGFFARS